MNDLFEKHREKIAVFVLILIPIVMMATSAGADIGQERSNRLTGWTRGVLYTGQLGVVQVLGGTQGLLGAWLSSDLAQENERLREENALLREEKARLIGVLQENARLRQQVGFKDAHPEFELVPARVIARDTSPYFRVLSIKITEDGKKLLPRMPVVVAGGVVGQVHKVYDGWADVIILSDPRSNIDALSQRNRAQGVVQGLGKERDYSARVAYLSEKDDVQVGDIMVTSGMGGICPRELIIGTVTSTAPDERRLFQQVVVEPAVDFSRLDMVYVITGVERPQIEGM